MRLFGYVRVSTSQQSFELQKQTLKNAGVLNARIFSDKLTGSSLERPGLQLLLLTVEEGDAVLITRLDRLGRNTLDMINLITQFNDIGVSIKFIEDGISTEGSMGRMVITILSAVAESERHRILERTSEGRLEAKSKGIKFGRLRTIDRSKLLKLHESGIKGTTLAKSLNISRAAVYKILREEGEINKN